jgi:type II secretory pathway pseudopilin PulG
MSTNSRGFTLVEVLIISPIIILFIGAFLALLVGLTGESLVVREKNTAAYDTQSALDDIEASIGQAITFLPTTDTVPIPQGKDNSTSAGTPFTNETTNEPNTLIIRSAATTSRPSDPARELIYMGAGACDSKNPLYTYFTIYFTALDLDTAGDTTDKALYKRTILPQNPACRTAWQRGSCDVSRMTSHPSVCKARDEKLVSGISTFDIQYYIGNSTTAVADSQAASATDVSVNLGVSKQVAGSPVQYTGTVRANSLNIQTSESSTGAITPPSNPPIAWSRNDTGPNPYRTTFTWSKVGNATKYIARYAINGGAPQEQDVLQSDNPSFNIDLAARKQTIDYFEVKVVTSGSGTISYGTPLSLPPRIPQWNECNFQNGWHNYKDWYGGNTFTTGGYTRTSSGIVGLKGLVRGGPVGSTICTLPAGFRPKFAGEKLIFQVTTANGGNWGRVDVEADGRIVSVSGGNDWFSLDGIMFLADTTGTTLPNPTWTTPTWQNGWSNYNTMYGGTVHSNLRTTTDSQGRRHIQGLGGYSGTAPVGVSMTVPIAAASGVLHYPAISGAGPGIVQVSSDGTIRTRSSATSWQSLQMIYRPSGATGWQNMPFSSGWTNYLNGFPTMQCHRGTDDVVIVQGLIRHPGGGNGTYIGDTSPCGRFSSGQVAGQADRLILSPWMSNETTGRIDMVNGISLLSQGTQDPWTALDGIHFIAD